MSVGVSICVGGMHAQTSKARVQPMMLFIGIPAFCSLRQVSYLPSDPGWQGSSLQGSSSTYLPSTEIPSTGLHLQICFSFLFSTFFLFFLFIFPYCSSSYFKNVSWEFRFTCLYTRHLINWTTILNQSFKNSEHTRLTPNQLHHGSQTSILLLNPLKNSNGQTWEWNTYILGSSVYSQLSFRLLQ